MNRRVSAAWANRPAWINLRKFVTFVLVAILVAIGWIVIKNNMEESKKVASAPVVNPAIAIALAQEKEPVAEKAKATPKPTMLQPKKKVAADATPMPVRRAEPAQQKAGYTVDSDGNRYKAVYFYTTGLPEKKRRSIVRWSPSDFTPDASRGETIETGPSWDRLKANYNSKPNGAEGLGLRVITSEGPATREQYLQERAQQGNRRTTRR